MKKLEMKQMEGIEGGKFWGTDTYPSCSPNPMGGEFCQTCRREYRLWIPWGPEDCDGNWYTI